MPPGRVGFTMGNDRGARVNTAVWQRAGPVRTASVKAWDAANGMNSWRLPVLTEAASPFVSPASRLSPMLRSKAKRGRGSRDSGDGMDFKGMTATRRRVSTEPGRASYVGIMKESAPGKEGARK